MTIHNWDPLRNEADLGEEIIAAAKKRQIKNILKSYVGMYDAFSELIQNSMDSVERRAVSEGIENYQPKLWIEVNLQENSFSVTDNGVGFNEAELTSFMSPDISFKTDETTRGNKGVGATYIAYGFNELYFATKGNGLDHGAEFKQGRDWVEDKKSVITRPVVIGTEFESLDFAKTDRGACFKIVFDQKYSRPKNLSYYTATTPDQWLYLLLLKTPLGTIYLDEVEQQNIVFDLRVVDKNGKAESVINRAATYIFPHDVVKSSVDLKTIFAVQEKMLADGKDLTKLPIKYTGKNGLYEFFTSDELKEFRIKLPDDGHELIDKYRVKAYAFFTYSTKVWDQVNDKIANLRKGFRVLKGGIQLANNKMVQGEYLVIPLTSNIGYQNQCHILIHFEDADPDLGRKGFQPELKELAEQLSVAIVNRMKRWNKRLLKSDSGADPDIVKEAELHEWLKQQEQHEENNPLELTSDKFFLPTKQISVTSVPQSEQDAIVLFNQLLAGGAIRGLTLMSTNQKTQYDGVFRFRVSEPLENHVYDRESNPLGVEELKFDKPHTSAPKVLEYKFNVDALMRDFENGDKNAADIHLVIAWTLGDEWRKTYDAVSYLDLENLHMRDWHGTTHRLVTSTSSIYVIALDELVAYLNDVDSVQEQQKARYSDGAL